MNNPLVIGIAISLGVALVCAVGYLLVARHRAADLLGPIARELHRPTHHAGAWVIAVRAGSEARIAEGLRRLAGRTAPPESVVDVLGSVGGKVLAHLLGPGSERAEHGRAWLAAVARRVGEARIPLPRGARSGQLVVVAYAGAEPPPKRLDLDEVREHLVRCVGASVVVCRTEEVTFVRERGGWLRYLALAGASAALALLLVLLVSAASPLGEAGKPPPVGSGRGASGEQGQVARRENDAGSDAGDHDAGAPPAAGPEKPAIARGAGAQGKADAGAEKAHADSKKAQVAAKKVDGNASKVKPPATKASAGAEGAIDPHASDKKDAPAPPSAGVDAGTAAPAIAPTADGGAPPKVGEVAASAKGASAK